MFGDFTEGAQVAKIGQGRLHSLIVTVFMTPFYIKILCHASQIGMQKEISVGILTLRNL
jgi:hypothetical protein